MTRTLTTSRATFHALSQPILCTLFALLLAGCSSDKKSVATLFSNQEGLSVQQGNLQPARLGRNVHTLIPKSWQCASDDERALLVHTDAQGTAQTVVYTMTVPSSISPLTREKTLLRTLSPELLPNAAFDLLNKLHDEGILPVTVTQSPFRFQPQDGDSFQGWDWYRGSLKRAELQNRELQWRFSKTVGWWNPDVSDDFVDTAAPRMRSAWGIAGFLITPHAQTTARIRTQTVILCSTVDDACRDADALYTLLISSRSGDIPTRSTCDALSVDVLAAQLDFDLPSVQDAFFDEEDYRDQLTPPEDELTEDELSEEDERVHEEELTENEVLSLDNNALDDEMLDDEMLDDELLDDGINRIDAQDAFQDAPLDAETPPTLRDESAE